ncbi:probable ATP-dependent DNA helicase RecS [Montipora foliosa]|uniref:probable ATP-dependent DNA helicase RecS n=1 Tax=Montipora foliosa TaxID=591990 RepID=UPI0035F179F3
MAFLEKEHQEFQVFERLSRRLGGLVLKKEQKEAITLLLQGKDVFAVLPTGFGKSLIYQNFVLIKQMEDESTSNSGGDRPSCLGFEKTADVLNEMKNNKFQVIYASAEQALSKDFLQLLRDESTALKRQLSLIVVDESHTVETWGKSKKAGKKVLEPFRKDFGSLSSLRSFCPGVPLLAITGTATTKMRSSIRQQLAMGTDAVTIDISPNRANIRFAAIKTAKDDQLSYLGWIVDLIREQNLSTPKTIIFCGTMHDVAKVFGFLLAELGNAAYVPGKPSIPENRLIGIFHSLTWPKYKVRVSKSFRENEGHVRVVVATSA